MIKRICRGLAAMLALAMLSACGVEARGQATDSQTAAPSGWEQVKQRSDLDGIEPASELVFWSTKEDGYEAYREAFMEETGITVTATYQGGYDDMVNKVMTSIASQDLPDIAQLGQRHGLAQIYDSGYLLPVEDYIDEALLADILPGFWKRFTYRDKKVILPFQNSMPILYYNAELFEQAGVEVPDSFDALVETSKVIKDKTGIYGFTTNSDTPWYVNALLYNSGSNYVDGDGRATINTPELKHILSLYHRMAVVDGSMAQVQHSTAQEDFTGGKVAMILSSAASYKKLTDLTNDAFPLRTALFPAVSTRNIPMGGNGLGLFKTSPAALKAATMFVTFMLDKERLATNTLNSGYIPVTNAAIATDSYRRYLEDPNRAVVHEQLDFLGGAAVHPADSLIWNKIQALIELVEITESPDYEAELGEIEKAVQDYLDAYQ